MQIYIIRHGESMANTLDQDPIEIGDAYIDLSSAGREQAFELGKDLRHQLTDNSLIYCSPYARTRQTLRKLLEGANLAEDELPNIFEDPRLREVERGYESEASQFHLRERHGWFYYRHEGGESPADCFDRSSSFIDSLWREQARTPRENIFIVCHGMVIRTLVMRWLHLTVEQFESMYNPDNCDVITIRPKTDAENVSFRSGQWEALGLRKRF